jgi:hypothetical protein
VWCSPDTGETWQEIHSGLPDALFVRAASLD